MTLFIVKPTYTLYTELFNIALTYYNIPQIDFPPGFEEKMIDTLSVLPSFPTVSTCTTANWTWQDDPYDDGYYIKYDEDKEKEVVWPWSKEHDKNGK